MCTFRFCSTCPFTHSEQAAIVYVMLQRIALMFILIVSVCKSTTRVIFTNSEFSADCVAIAGVVRKLNWTNVVIVYDLETGQI